MGCLVKVDFNMRSDSGARNACLGVIAHVFSNEGKQALEIFFYLNRFTSHRASKTLGNRKLSYSDLFSSTMCSVSNDSK